MALNSSSKQIDKLSKLASQSNPNLSAIAPACGSGENSRVKPSFAAPDQTLEKSLHQSLQQKVEELERKSSFKRNSRQSSSNNPKEMPITDEEKQLWLLANASSANSNPIAGISAEAVESPLVVSNLPGIEVSQSILSTVGEGGQGGVRTLSMLTKKISLEERPFLRAIFDAMNCPENDYLPLFALCLLYAIQRNEGMSEVMLSNVGIPAAKSTTVEWYNSQLTDKLLQVLYSACQYASRIRLITLNVCINMLKQISTKMREK